MKPKQSVKGGTDFEDFDFEDFDEDEPEPDDADGTLPKMIRRTRTHDPVYRQSL